MEIEFLSLMLFVTFFFKQKTKMNFFQPQANIFQQFKPNVNITIDSPMEMNQYEQSVFQSVIYKIQTYFGFYSFPVELTIKIQKLRNYIQEITTAPFSENQSFFNNFLLEPNQAEMTEKQQQEYNEVIQRFQKGFNAVSLFGNGNFSHSSASENSKLENKENNEQKDDKTRLFKHLQRNIPKNQENQPSKTIQTAKFNKLPNSRNNIFSALRNSIETTENSETSESTNSVSEPTPSQHEFNDNQISQLIHDHYEEYTTMIQNLIQQYSIAWQIPLEYDISNTTIIQFLTKSLQTPEFFNLYFIRDILLQENKATMDKQQTSQYENFKTTLTNISSRYPEDLTELHQVYQQQIQQFQQQQMQQLQQFQNSNIQYLQSPTQFGSPNSAATPQSPSQVYIPQNYFIQVPQIMSVQNLTQPGSPISQTSQQSPLQMYYPQGYFLQVPQEMGVQNQGQMLQQQQNIESQSQEYSDYSDYDYNYTYSDYYSDYEQENIPPQNESKEEIPKPQLLNQNTIPQTVNTQNSTITTPILKHTTHNQLQTPKGSDIESSPKTTEEITKPKTTIPSSTIKQKSNTSNLVSVMTSPNNPARLMSPMRSNAQIKAEIKNEIMQDVKEAVKEAIKENKEEKAKPAPSFNSIKFGPGIKSSGPKLNSTFVQKTKISESSQVSNNGQAPVQDSKTDQVQNNVQSDSDVSTKHDSALTNITNSTNNQESNKKGTTTKLAQKSSIFGNKPALTNNKPALPNSKPLFSQKAEGTQNEESTNKEPTTKPSIFGNKPALTNNKPLFSQKAQGEQSGNKQPNLFGNNTQKPVFGTKTSLSHTTNKPKENQDQQEEPPNLIKPKEDKDSSESKEENSVSQKSKITLNHTGLKTGSSIGLKTGGSSISKATTPIGLKAVPPAPQQQGKIVISLKQQKNNSSVPEQKVKIENTSEPKKETIPNGKIVSNILDNGCLKVEKIGFGSIEFVFPISKDRIDQKQIEMAITKREISKFDCNVSSFCPAVITFYHAIEVDNEENLREYLTNLHKYCNEKEIQLLSFDYSTGDIRIRVDNLNKYPINVDF